MAPAWLMLTVLSISFKCLQLYYSEAISGLDLAVRETSDPDKLLQFSRKMQLKTSDVIVICLDDKNPTGLKKSLVRTFLFNHLRELLLLLFLSSPFSKSALPFLILQDSHFSMSCSWSVGKWHIFCRSTVCPTWSPLESTSGDAIVRRLSVLCYCKCHCISTTQPDYVNMKTHWWCLQTPKNHKNSMKLGAMR